MFARVQTRFRGLSPRLWTVVGLLTIVFIGLARLRDMGVLRQGTVLVLGLAAGTAIVVLAAVVGRRRS
jgi:hypothetical protein